MNEHKDCLITLNKIALCYHTQRQLFSKVKQEIWALKDVTFKIYKGEKLGIIGRNGCGKSTLMRLLTGIIEQNRGDLIFHQKINVQLLSLGVGLEGNLSGRENAILNGMLLGKSRSYMVSKIEKIKAFSDLEDFFEYPVNTYSSGMVTRLGFSVAIEAQPDVLLLDELLSVGDASFAEKSQKAIRERFSSRDQTVLLISHDPQVIHKMCERAVWIENGKTVMEGPTDKVNDAYLEFIMQKSSSSQNA